MRAAFWIATGAELVNYGDARSSTFSRTPDIRRPGPESSGDRHQQPDGLPPRSEVLVLGELARSARPSSSRRALGIRDVSPADRAARSAADRVAPPSDP